LGPSIAETDGDQAKGVRQPSRGRDSPIPRESPTAHWRDDAVEPGEGWMPDAAYRSVVANLDPGDMPRIRWACSSVRALA